MNFVTSKYILSGKIAEAQCAAAEPAKCREQGPSVMRGKLVNA